MFDLEGQVAGDFFAQFAAREGKWHFRQRLLTRRSFVCASADPTWLMCFSIDQHGYVVIADGVGQGWEIGGLSVALAAALHEGVGTGKDGAGHDLTGGR